mmetsp:Transcript_70491/g.124443  ORF Transcript_70491/g.124443 Transcript_70491/m.124443 type:complete len:96 (+) Transcript_70491:94-381(+)
MTPDLLVLHHAAKMHRCMSHERLLFSNDDGAACQGLVTFTMHYERVLQLTLHSFLNKPPSTPGSSLPKALVRLMPAMPPGFDLAKWQLQQLSLSG